MPHQPATRIERPGYSHVHPADRPYIGVNSYTEESILWELFNAEATLRRVYQLTHDPQSNPGLQERFDQIEQLPADR